MKKTGITAFVFAVAALAAAAIPAAQETVTGTWTMTKGTSSLAGEHGKGTYTYTIVRMGSATVFSLASIVLVGSIVRAPAPA